MDWYNGFSPEQRMDGDKIVKEAIKKGILPPLNEVSCEICGQDKGVRHYHAEDYSPDKIVDDVIPVCWECHMHIHTKNKNNPRWIRYEKRLKRGEKSRPHYNKWWTPDDDYNEDDLISLDEWL
ncbi:MAG: hypothetical protein BZ138_07865 [Methanosphaera sp. rholeuAM270]|nr:MAG: hypothetical protein BZ138_07865 [Methanosphaera sp. rholeuAM270]